MKFTVTNTLITPNTKQEFEEISKAEECFESCVKLAIKNRIVLTKHEMWYTSPNWDIKRSWRMYCPRENNDTDFQSWNQCELCWDPIKDTHGFCMRCKKVL